MTALAFDRVAARRGERTLFADLSFALRPGDAALVTGPNGVGKSTLVRIAAGLLPPAAGAVAREGRIALMTEAHALDPERPLAAALAFWASLDRTTPALAAVGLESLADAPVRILSTGQRRRAALARVIASDAPIWLLDEPVNGLDADGVALLEALVARHRAGGGIVLIATHQRIALPGSVEVRL